MANHAHSTRTSVAPQAGAQSALLPRRAGRQLGPVSLAIRAMRTADPDLDWQRLRALRKRIADRIEADLALLDALDGDQDLEADYAMPEHGPGGTIVILGRSTDDEDGDNGCADLDGALEQHGHGAFNDVVFA